jgi:hypothetical protein
VPHEPEVGGDEGPTGFQRAPAPPKRLLADRVEDDVVGLVVPGEVLLQVVDDLVRSQRADELDVLGVARRRDASPEVLGELHAGGADRTGCAVDQDLPSLQPARLAKARQCERRAVADRCSLLERHAGGDVCECSALTHADVLRMRPRPHAEDPVAHGELAHAGPDLRDHARQLGAHDSLLRAQEAGDEPADEELGAPKPGVGSGDRRRVDLDEDLVVLRDRPVQCLEMQDLRRPIPVVDDGSHCLLFLS